MNVEGGLAEGFHQRQAGEQLYTGSGSLSSAGWRSGASASRPEDTPRMEDFGWDSSGIAHSCHAARWRADEDIGSLAHGLDTSYPPLALVSSFLLCGLAAACTTRDFRRKRRRS
jgi:hypothetical protein